MVPSNSKLPRDTKIFVLPVHYISNTCLSILAQPSNVDFWIRVIYVFKIPIPFKLPFNRNGNVPKLSTTFGTTLVFTFHILLNSLARF